MITGLLWVLGLGVAGLCGLIGFMQWRGPAAPLPAPAPALVPPPAPRPMPVEEPLLLRQTREALRRAGHGDLLVADWGLIPDGLRMRLRMPSYAMRCLSVEAAEAVAVGLAEVSGLEICSDWVQLDRTPEAGTYRLTVVVEDVMARVIPYVDSAEWATIDQPRCGGFRLDGEPQPLRLDSHGQIAGATTNGKTALVHVELAEETRTRNCVSWVAGTEKVYDLVAGWVEPYLGSDLPVPLDWVASGQRDTVAMLATAMRIARWRQRQPMAERHGFTTIIIHLDEASFALRNRVVRGRYQGVECTASQLAAMITQGAGSANVWLKFASQRGVSDHLGDQGSDSRANVGYTAAFRTRDPDDVGRLTGNHKLGVPRHRGEYLLTADADPVRVKAPYLQSVDPSKPLLHDGPTVADVAWARRHFPRQLDPGSTAVAGADYQGRHTRMSDAMRDYLTGFEPEVDEVSDAHRSGYAATMAELDNLDMSLFTAGR